MGFSNSVTSHVQARAYGRRMEREKNLGWEVNEVLPLEKNEFNFRRERGFFFFWKNVFAFTSRLGERVLGWGWEVVWNTNVSNFRTNFRRQRTKTWPPQATLHRLLTAVYQPAKKYERRKNFVCRKDGEKGRGMTTSTLTARALCQL